MTTSHTTPIVEGALRTHKAHLNYLHIAPRKVRLVADTIRGLRVQEAEARLMLSPLRPARPLLKLLRSAVANAVNNQKAIPEQLMVSSIWVNQGSILKRSLPRAMGRATPIHKIMSHVTIILSETMGTTVTPRFTITKKQKKDHDHTPKRRTRRVKSESTDEKGGSDGRPGGFFKRVFNRKSV